MSDLVIPQNYSPVLSVKETEHAIVMIKDFFQLALSTELNLTRVTAPLFVPQGTGLNDDLNGVERAVSFPVKDMDDAPMEIVHSLAKWKRVKVTDLRLGAGFGIYTDMNAIRADEELDNVHSLYVDQWDWEMAIREEDRTVYYLREVVRSIFRCLKRTEFFIYDRYDKIKPILPDDITFIYAEDLQKAYPDKTPKERENIVAEKYGAVFVVGIGGDLADGKPHDGRAPDYDDWITESGDGHRGLNGDLIVWNPVLNCAFELSSMGIRVSPQSLEQQLALRNCTDRKKLYFHSKLLAGELTQTMGGGIGQSRLCMYFLRKAHIGETQVSVWPEVMGEQCRQVGIPLL
ncbi:MAG: aspartate--ammonia ligase [Candidatus Treponema excrementipullorum]|nr:aspartate--ammonia ligase [Spirochaetia bacterium]MDD7011524.1 aspartate--ammonia ligase [Candidatus Treponema excrementipullorum]MCI6953545.1 aspartate--ammonia ligase [Spirochaetia bacterium]MDY2755316.1 aspartate--ammonia ligase [Candidatus Treponema excrementipullorum]MDY4466846.1 aspartate--ammonia ligase [Candidatus Treponema excrementipullorum]